MRQYRGKRIDNGEWVYGWYVFDARYNKHYIYRLNRQAEAICEVMTCFEVDPDSVGQQIDKQDKNKKEIYEEDTLKVPAHYIGDYWEKERTQIVEWDNSDEGPGYYLSLGIQWKQTEIIGNIFDNGTE